MNRRRWSVAGAAALAVVMGSTLWVQPQVFGLGSSLACGLVDWEVLAGGPVDRADRFEQGELDSEHPQRRCYAGWDGKRSPANDVTIYTFDDWGADDVSRGWGGGQQERPLELRRGSGSTGVVAGNPVGWVSWPCRGKPAAIAIELDYGLAADDAVSRAQRDHAETVLRAAAAGWAHMLDCPSPTGNPGAASGQVIQPTSTGDDLAGLPPKLAKSLAALSDNPDDPAAARQVAETLHTEATRRRSPHSARVAEATVSVLGDTEYFPDGVPAVMRNRVAATLGAYMDDVNAVTPEGTDPVPGSGHARFHRHDVTRLLTDLARDTSAYRILTGHQMAHAALRLHQTA